MDEAEFMTSWLRELDAGQWRSSRWLLSWQRQRLESLLRHARETVPFYRTQLDPLFDDSGSIDWDAWTELPLLTRDDVLEQRDALLSTDVPADHGELEIRQTSGTTAKPIAVPRTRRAQLCSLGLYHRGFLWHGFDMTAKMAWIVPLDKSRAQYPDAERHDFWTVPAQLLGIRGELVILNINAATDRQIDWLERERPRYLHTFPTNARALARNLLDSGRHLAGLERIMLVGETLADDDRVLCRRAFRADVIDSYGAIECGQIALQCPDALHYHVNGETVFLELVDSEGRPVEPGGVGEVVVTPLHNYAFPLIRYQLDDFAVSGTACSCGRGLPVIAGIKGRSRHMFRFPDGTEVWPDVKTANLQRFLAPRQWQIAQVAPLEIEVRFVPGDPAFRPDYAGMSAYIRALFGQDLTVRYSLVDSLLVTPGGKFHDYVCELQPGRLTLVRA